MSEINIWLDDIRPAPDGFIWVKNVAELTNFYNKCVLDTKQKINIISLDNDLGEGMPEGYKFLDYIEPRVILAGDPLPAEIRVHSANPITQLFIPYDCLEEHPNFIKTYT